MNTTAVSFVRRAIESFITAAHNSEDSDTGRDYIVSLYSADTLLNQVVTNYSNVTFDLEFTDNMRVEIVAQDGAATKVEKITNERRRSGRYTLVPGFGLNYGILGSELASLVCQKANYIGITPAQYEEDLEWLLDEKVIARC
ncbi:hypothetical protein CGI23_19685 [Vibrio parahaemolyticus]|uniref:hypothetical protein n=1 Tax=Vibrio harveyi group TaxID=717610 RepID=UPI0011248DD2|nr:MULTISPECIES: hypothetical protein [Vibrio harveyi group]MDV5082637.1 hypothetical protein [Vibrio parahaemolyticus]TOK21477.1 hypothetical protein CGI23_19685 [Vibrio parahaemolyticus]